MILKLQYILCPATVCQPWRPLYGSNGAVKTPTFGSRVCSMWHLLEREVLAIVNQNTSLIVLSFFPAYNGEKFRNMHSLSGYECLRGLHD